MQLSYLELAYTLGDGEAPGFENLVAPGGCEAAGFGNLVALGECAVAPDPMIILYLLYI